MCIYIFLLTNYTDYLVFKFLIRHVSGWTSTIELLTFFNLRFSCT